jgi:hypothetical protein
MGRQPCDVKGRGEQANRQVHSQRLWLRGLPALFGSLGSPGKAACA